MLVRTAVVVLGLCTTSVTVVTGQTLLDDLLQNQPTQIVLTGGFPSLDAQCATSWQYKKGNKKTQMSGACVSVEKFAPYLPGSLSGGGTNRNWCFTSTDAKVYDLNDNNVNKQWMYCDEVVQYVTGDVLGATEAGLPAPGTPCSYQWNFGNETDVTDSCIAFSEHKPYIPDELKDAIKITKDSRWCYTGDNGIYDMDDLDDNKNWGICVDQLERITTAPSERPTSLPTASPTISPSTTPTGNPSRFPTMSPSGKPTISPTHYPTQSGKPTPKPTLEPTMTPTSLPTGSPIQPTLTPTRAPTRFGQPTEKPTTASPTSSPIIITKAPVPKPTKRPTKVPGATNEPTLEPTISPTTFNSSIGGTGKPADVGTTRTLSTSVIVVLIVMVLISGLLAFAQYVTGRKFLTLFPVFLSLFDFITDALFAVELSKNGLWTFCYMVIAFVALTMTINFILSGLILKKFIKDDHDDLTRQTTFVQWANEDGMERVVATYVFLGLFTLESFQVSCSNIWPNAKMFNAPLSTYQKRLLTAYSLANNFFEDIPQLLLVLISLDRTNGWTVTALTSFILSSISLIYTFVARSSTVFLICFTQSPSTKQGKPVEQRSKENPEQYKQPPPLHDDEDENDPKYRSDSIPAENSITVV